MTRNLISVRLDLWMSEYVPAPDRTRTRITAHAHAHAQREIRGHSHVVRVVCVSVSCVSCGWRTGFVQSGLVFEECEAVDAQAVQARQRNEPEEQERPVVVLEPTPALARRGPSTNRLPLCAVRACAVRVCGLRGRCVVLPEAVLLVVEYGGPDRDGERDAPGGHVVA